LKILHGFSTAVASCQPYRTRADLSAPREDRVV